jgi:hypothetical protein
VEDYRCYFLAADGRFVGVETFPAKDDEEALLLARRLYAIHAESVIPRHYGFELWQRSRRVHTELMP